MLTEQPANSYFLTNSMQAFTSTRLRVQQRVSSHLLSLQAIAFKHKDRAPKALEDLKKKTWTPYNSRY